MKKTVLTGGQAPLGYALLVTIILSGCASRAPETEQPRASDHDVPAPASDEQAVQSASSEEDAWSIAGHTKSADALRTFIARYPDSRFKNTAMLRLKLLERGAIQ